jgi:hypothetical protein
MFITQLKDGRVVYLNDKQLLALKGSGQLLIDKDSIINSDISNGVFFKNYILNTLNSLNY